MNVVRSLLSFGAVVFVAALVGTWFSVESQAQAQDKPIVGAWTRVKEVSEIRPTPRPEGQDDGGGRRGGGPGGGGGRGGGRRGGFGGGFGGAPNGGVGNNGDREAAVRLRDAISDIMNPPDHLVIVQTDTMVVMTGPDGRTTRLLPDGKKIKDDNTGIERRTKWDGDRLVCEISGAGPGKITQTYSVDPEGHQLRIAIDTENGRGRAGQGAPGLPAPHVYNADAR